MSVHKINAPKLVELRSKKKYSQRALAEAAGCSKGSIERAERGETLRHSLIEGITAALGVATDAIIVRDDAPPDLRTQFAPYLNQLRIDFEDLRFIEIRTVDAGAQSTDYVPKVEDLFVEPYLLNASKSPEETPTEWADQSLASTVLAQPGPKVILGDPGSGKSTLVAWITMQLAHSHSTTFGRTLGDRMPLPMVLREMRFPENLTWEVLIEEFHHWCGRRRTEFQESIGPDDMQQWVRDGKAVLLLDGLDEIGIESRKGLRKAVWDLIEQFPENIVLCTSRPVGYEDVVFDRDRLAEIKIVEALALRNKSRENAAELATHLVEDPSLSSALDSRCLRMTRLYLALFDDSQIRSFIRHWYVRQLSSVRVAGDKMDGMWRAITANPATHTLARIPNVLTIMAILHERRNVLPDGRTELYRAVADLYLTSIDQARGIPQAHEIRATAADQKLWLGRVAWEIQQRRATNARRAENGRVDDATVLLITREELKDWIKAEAHDPLEAEHSPADIEGFILKVQERAGLMIERGDRRYSFIHLSFVEYFAGHYLLHSFEDRLRDDAVRQELAPDTIWCETLLFAIEDARETLPRKRIPLVMALMPWFNPATCEVPPVENKEASRARSNEWILLTRLSEGRFAGFESQRPKIRAACEIWAGQVDPVNADRWSRHNRFIDRWLQEVEDNSFCRDFWCRTLKLTRRSQSNLDLFGHGIGDVGVRALTEGLPNLTTLNLTDNGIGEAGARALAEGLSNLTTLCLWDNKIGDAGARALAKGLPNLTTLNLMNNGIGEAGARALAESLPNLTTLLLGVNKIGDAGARALVEGLPNLTTLNLSFNGIGEETRAELQSMLATRIKNLYL